MMPACQLSQLLQVDRIIARLIAGVDDLIGDTGKFGMQKLLYDRYRKVIHRMRIVATRQIEVGRL